jgi:ribonuclease H / adenosylcobalamin/alpha-ribazole phosphatase
LARARKQFAVRAQIHTDGSAIPTSRGEEGAGAGFVVIVPGGSPDAVARAEPLAIPCSQNEAEYQAMAVALRVAAEMGADEVLVRADSKLIVEQLSGKAKVLNPKLVLLHAAVQEERRRFKSVRFILIPRMKNKVADELSKLGAAKSRAANMA